MNGVSHVDGDSYMPAVSARQEGGMLNRSFCQLLCLEESCPSTLILKPDNSISFPPPPPSPYVPVTSSEAAPVLELKWSVLGQASHPNDSGNSAYTFVRGIVRIQCKDPQERLSTDRACHSGRQALTTCVAIAVPAFVITGNGQKSRHYFGVFQGGSEKKETVLRNRSPPPCPSQSLCLCLSPFACALSDVSEHAPLSSSCVWSAQGTLHSRALGRKGKE
ncbi:hypothetical protein mRhiFer1_008077 [Rhinolophus ferrumequinum]|uniref:Uncharacterized protein n=1 Tax=Rhinolophus ferrumequinum TaxID=59479 RepID=A0A7J7WQZ4_RHIFE|nr:hypothetical protein mRhiFer1_008077 [Rhinolophus ferrumequinum]